MTDLQKRECRPARGGIANGEANNIGLDYNAKYTSGSGALQSQLEIDGALECRIDNIRLMFLGTKAGETERRRTLWNELKAAITSRSPEQIRRMEQAKGLLR